MREDICTIPIHDVFDTVDGCPICRMRAKLEQRALSYITGDAMMQPNIRTETNQKGFCGMHLNRLLQSGSALPVALMLQTHMQQIATVTVGKQNKDGKRSGEILNSCFLCEKVNWGMRHMLDTLYRSYETDADFRTLFERQNYFCFPHYHLLVSGAEKSKIKRYRPELLQQLNGCAQQITTQLEQDLSRFCSMYDYRNSGPDADWGDSKTANSRTVKFLCGENENQT